MKKVKIQGKEYNCSNIVYWYIKGHEKSELELQQRIDKAIEYCEEIKSRAIDIDDTDFDLGEDFTARRLLNILKGSEEYE